jgi:hypothetical protein
VNVIPGFSEVFSDTKQDKAVPINIAKTGPPMTGKI